MQAAPESQQAGQMGQHFEQPHHRKFVAAPPAVKAGGLHLWAADTGESRAGQQFPQGGHQGRAELVAGRLTRDQRYKGTIRHLESGGLRQRMMLRSTWSRNSTSGLISPAASAISCNRPRASSRVRPERYSVR